MYIAMCCIDCTPPGVSTVTGKSIILNQIILDPSTTSFTFDPNDGISEILVTSSGIILNVITIPNDVSDTTINGNDVLTSEPDGRKSLTFTNGFVINAVVNNVNVIAAIPDGVKVYGPSSWNGVINLPTSRPTSSVNSTSGIVTSVIEIGFDDTELTFDKPVRLVFEGKANQNISFERGGITTEITTKCSDDDSTSVTNQLGNSGECTTTNNGNRIVWTFHFTNFVISTKKGSGSSGEVSPPTLSGSGFGTNEFPFTVNGLGYKLDQYSNTIPTINLETGNPVQLKVAAYDPGGVQSIQHIAMYMNLRGITSEIQNSDTYITYDKNNPIQVSDPNRYFGSVNVQPVQSGNKLELTFDLIFAKPMEKSDIIFRIWDDSRNSADTKILDAIMVTTDIAQNSQQSLPSSLQSDISSPIQTPPIPFLPVWIKNNAKLWAEKQIGNVDFIRGIQYMIKEKIIDVPNFTQSSESGQQNVPEWIRNNAMWWANDFISDEDFVRGIEYLVKVEVIRV